MADPIIRILTDYLRSQSLKERKTVGIADASEQLSAVIELHMHFMAEQQSMWMAELISLSDNQDPVFSIKYNSESLYNQFDFNYKASFFSDFTRTQQSPLYSSFDQTWETF